MSTVFWTKSRKAKLLKQSKTMTVCQMARYHLQPQAEIERMLRFLTSETLIMRTYSEGKYTVTVYYPAYAGGVRRQIMGERSMLW